MTTLLPIRRMLLASVALCILVSPATCFADDVSEMLQGTWKGDGDKTAKALADQGVEEARIEQIVSEIENITITFGEDGSFAIEMKMSGIEETLDGTYEVTSADEDEQEGVVLIKVEAFGDAQSMDFKFVEMGAFIGLTPEGEDMAMFKKVDE